VLFDHAAADLLIATSRRLHPRGTLHQQQELPAGVARFGDQLSCAVAANFRLLCQFTEAVRRR
jgi:hypothetical protein